MGIITTAFKRRRLPHWEVAGKVYFLTFRLRNSLPKDVVLRLQEQRKSILSLEDNTDELNRFHRYEFREIENILDSVHNDENSFLANDNIAPVLMEAFDYLENKYCWRFPSFVIMPNHIHCLCVGDKSGEAKK